MGPPEILENQSFEPRIPRRSNSMARKAASSNLSDGSNDERACSKLLPQVVS